MKTPDRLESGPLYVTAELTEFSSAARETAIQVDSSGNAYVGGAIDSQTFPIHDGWKHRRIRDETQPGGFSPDFLCVRGWRTVPIAGGLWLWIKSSEKYFSRGIHSDCFGFVRATSSQKSRVFERVTCRVQLCQEGVIAPFELVLNCPGGDRKVVRCRRTYFLGRFSDPRRRADCLRWRSRRISGRDSDWWGTVADFELCWRSRSGPNYSRVRCRLRDLPGRILEFSGDSRSL